MRVYYNIEFDGPHAFGSNRDGTIATDGVGVSGSMDITHESQILSESEALDEAEKAVKGWLASGGVQTLGESARSAGRCVVPTHRIRRVVLTLFDPNEPHELDALPEPETRQISGA
jgi:hypothetical protein